MANPLSDRGPDLEVLGKRKKHMYRSKSFVTLGTKLHLGNKVREVIFLPALCLKELRDVMYFMGLKKVSTFKTDPTLTPFSKFIHL